MPASAPWRGCHRFACGLGDPLDGWPGHVPRTQPIGLTQPQDLIAPLIHVDCVDCGCPRHRCSPGRMDGEYAVGCLGLRSAGIGNPEQGGDLLTRKPVQQPGLPAKPGGRDADGGNGMSYVVLAVAVGALAVFPRLAPVHGGQTHQQASGRLCLHQPDPGSCGQLGADLQGMWFRRIVGDNRLLEEVLEWSAQEVALRGVQIAAGGVYPQCPS